MVHRNDNDVRMKSTPGNVLTEEGKEGWGWGGGEGEEVELECVDMDSYSKATFASYEKKCKFYLLQDCRE